MTREQFIEKWRRHVAGVIAVGGSRVRALRVASIAEALQEKPPAEVGEIFVDVADESLKLLGQLYDSLQPKPAPPAQPSTGAKKP